MADKVEATFHGGAKPAYVVLDEIQSFDYRRDVCVHCDRELTAAILLLSLPPQRQWLHVDDQSSTCYPDLGLRSSQAYPKRGV